MISLEKWKILTTSQNLPKMRAIWAKLLLPQAFKSCPKSNKSPNLVTLGMMHVSRLETLSASVGKLLRLSPKPLAL